MRLLGKLVGLGLLLLGIYFLGQNIIFTSRIANYWWQDIPAAGSVLAMLAGILTLIYGREARSLGWLFIGVGIALVFISGKVVLQPTSLWTFFLAFFSFASGMQLITTGRLRF